MRNYLKQVIKLFAFWLGTFAIQRLVFLLLFVGEYSSKTFVEVTKSFIFSIPLDISAACYLSAIPILIYFISSFFSKTNYWNKTADWITYILIVVNGIIFTADLSLFKSWHSKINYTAISYMKYPSEVFANGLSAGYILNNTILILTSIFFIFIYNRYVRNYHANYKNVLSKVTGFIITVALLIVGIRGGLQKHPIHKNWSYYSDNIILNNAALNSFWNFFDIIFKPISNENPYTFFTSQQASALANSYYTKQNGPDISILNTTKPNVLLLFWESCGADVVSKLNGEKNVTPYFDTLCKEGLLFTNFYSTGFRTDQGLVASLSGFPAQPQTRIIEEFGKFDKLPNVITELNKSGYTSHYYYGGRSLFANTAAYLTSAGVSTIVDEKNFKDQKRTVWGVYDEYLLAFINKEFCQLKQPFFSIAATITSHEDFEADVPRIFKEDTYSNGYRNTMHYTDSCIYSFIKDAQKQLWYRNTIIIIVADHGHQQPLGRALYEKRMHQIPMLWLGGALKEEWKNKQDNTLGSHVDIPSTLLNQLNINSSKFKWSSNLFAPKENRMAFYTFDNGAGIITDRHYLTYATDKNNVLEKDSTLIPAQELIQVNIAKAVLQHFFEEYVKAGK